MSRRTLEVLDLPSLDELLDTKGVVSFPYTKTFEDAANEPFCFLHTSGSTGVPKPIPWSHALIGTMDAVRLLPPVDGDDGLAPWTSDWKNGDKIYSSFPMSHVSYLGFRKACSLHQTDTMQQIGRRDHHGYTYAGAIRSPLHIGTCRCFA